MSVFDLYDGMSTEHDPFLSRINHLLHVRICDLIFDFLLKHNKKQYAYKTVMPPLPLQALHVLTSVRVTQPLSMVATLSVVVTSSIGLTRLSVRIE